MSSLDKINDLRIRQHIRYVPRRRMPRVVYVILAVALGVVLGGFWWVTR